MLPEWRRFVGWKILEHFLAHPSGEFYIKELARTLAVSPASVHSYCGQYVNDGILRSEKKANAKMMRLDNDSPLARAIKRMYAMASLWEAGLATALGASPEAISFALYGSFASGDYDDRSDADIIAVSDKKIRREPFVKLQERLGRRVQLTELSLAKWIALKKEKDPFALSVLANNVVLRGAEL